MKAFVVGIIGALILGATTSSYAQAGYQVTKVKLTRTTTNNNTFVKTVITEADIIAKAAEGTTNNIANLQLLFGDGGFLVADVVHTTLVANVAHLVSSGPLTNVALMVMSGTATNTENIAVFCILASTGEGALPADFVGTMLFNYRYTTPTATNKLPTASFSADVLGGSVSNAAIYVGTIKTSGKLLLY